MISKNVNIRTMSVGESAIVALAFLTGTNREMKRTVWVRSPRNLCGPRLGRRR